MATVDGEQVFELPEGCVVADFVVHGPWRQENVLSGTTLHLRVVRRCWKGGVSSLHLQSYVSDMGTCGAAWSDHRDTLEKNAERLLLERLASL